MPRSLWICVIALQMILSATATAVTLSKEQIVLMQELEAKRFFKKESCRQIADGFLIAQGLPAIGNFRRQTIPPNMDRSHATDPLPKLTDQLVDDERKFVANLKMYEVKKRGGPAWNIQLARKLGETSAETTYVFSVTGTKDSPLCKFKNIQFKTTQVEIFERSAADGSVFELENCLDVFLKKPIFTKIPSEDQARILYSWVKSDCEFGLQYHSKPGR